MDAEFDVDFKGAFTIAKALWTGRGILHAAKRWRGSDSSLASPASRLLAYNAVLVALITAYKLLFGGRDLAPLFALQLLGNYGSLLTFAALAGFGSHPKIRKGKRGDRRIGLAIWTLHASYAIVLVLGFRGAACSEEEGGTIYPVSFAMSYALFLASYAMLLYVKRRGFDVKDLKRDGEDEDESEEDDLELFEAQVAAFFAQQRMLVAWHTVEIALGYVLLETLFGDEARPVTCDEGGTAWIVDGSKAGKLFLLLHTFGVKQSLGVASNVFSKTVKKLEKKRKREDKRKKEE